MKEIAEFAKLNRLQMERLHSDVHADCYIPVIIATIILSDGSIKDVSIVKSSSVPIVDRYFRYIIEQAAPAMVIEFLLSLGRLQLKRSYCRDRVTRVTW